MTVFEMVRILLRRWPVLVVGMVLTAAVAQGPARGEAVVFSRSELAFLAPPSEFYPNALRTTSGPVIMTAGVVARRVTGAGQLPKLASTQATLIGQGVRDGWSLRLPDSGGQWAPNFSSQVLVLEVVGPSEAVVQERKRTLIGRVQQELTALQKQFGVADANKISVIEAPSRSVLYQVKGDRRRALVMTVLLGAGATSAAALGTDRMLLRWRARRGRRPRRPVTGRHRQANAPA